MSEDMSHSPNVLSNNTPITLTLRIAVGIIIFVFMFAGAYWTFVSIEDKLLEEIKDRKSSIENFEKQINNRLLILEERSDKRNKRTMKHIEKNEKEILELIKKGK